MTPHFTNPAAARSWSAYVARIDVALAATDGATAADLRRELLSHLCDGYDAATGDEAARVHSVTADFGAPEDFLRPLEVEGSAARSLLGELARGARLALVGLTLLIGYAALAAFAAMAVLQPAFPDHIGLFGYPGGGFSFGIARDTGGATELLGAWTIPVALTAVALLWWSLGGLLVRVRRA